MITHPLRFQVLGARIDGASPVGTASGDVGAAGVYEPETPREPWRIR